MRRVRVLPFILLVLAATLARAQDTTSSQDTLAYTTTIVTVRAKPFAGASAHCRDGTYSFSRSRSGTCSHHGGVAEWLH